VTDPFKGIEADLDFERADPRTVEVPLPAGAPADEAEARFLLSVGLFDLLAEAAEGTGPEEAAARLDTLLSRVEAVEPTVRFWLFEQSGRAEEYELLARMRGRDVAMMREWLLPRLRRDIEAYRARVQALRQVLGEVGT
jgi:hypothetical protein